MMGTRDVGGGWSPPRERRRWTAADGRRMAEALRRSGEPARSFARRYGLEEQRVRRWAARFEVGTGEDSREAGAGQDEREVGFAPVTIVAAREGETAGVEIAVSGVVVRVGRGFDAELLRRVLATLGAAC